LAKTDKNAINGKKSEIKHRLLNMKDFIIQAKIDKSAFYMLKIQKHFAVISDVLNIKERASSMLRMVDRL